MKSRNQKNNVINFPTSMSESEREIEAILFAAEEPLDIESIESKIKKKKNITKSLGTAKNLSGLMSQQKSVQKKLSKAGIETLAIIVYHQPVTRAEIEEIRGVSFGTNTLEILLELNWVKPHGRRDVPGRPIQYATTEDFLSHFNLQKLSDLPNIEELTSAGLIDGGNIDSSIFGTKTFFKEKQEEKKENTYTNIDEMLGGSLKSEED